MRYRIKGWEKFQHFKDRRPPWIKLYKDILDDPDWHSLEPESAKVLVMLWLIVSEDESMTGVLPDIRKLAFRLRMPERAVLGHCSKLSHWLYQLDINLIQEKSDDTAVISDGYRSDAPETETETEKNSRASRSAHGLNGAFTAFWSAYPRKKSKGDAEKAWLKIKPDEQLASQIIAAVGRATTSDDWTREGGKFIPHPATWLNAKGWEDELGAEQAVRPDL